MKKAVVTPVVSLLAVTAVVAVAAAVITSNRSKNRDSINLSSDKDFQSVTKQFNSFAQSRDGINLSSDKDFQSVTKQFNSFAQSRDGINLSSNKNFQEIQKFINNPHAMLVFNPDDGTFQCFIKNEKGLWSNSNCTIINFKPQMYNWNNKGCKFNFDAVSHFLKCTEEAKKTCGDAADLANRSAKEARTAAMTLWEIDQICKKDDVEKLQKAANKASILAGSAAFTAKQTADVANKAACTEEQKEQAKQAANHADQAQQAANLARETEQAIQTAAQVVRQAEQAIQIIQIIQKAQNVQNVLTKEQKEQAIQAIQAVPETFFTATTAAQKVLTEEVIQKELGELGEINQIIQKELEKLGEINQAKQVAASILIQMEQKIQTVEYRMLEILKMKIIEKTFNAVEETEAVAYNVRKVALIIR